MNQPSQTGRLVVCLFLYIPVVWAALLLAQSLGGGLADILTSLTAALDAHKHRRPLNVLVIGGSGAGRSRSCVKPNTLEANKNYVITDSKSEVLLATGGYLKSQRYDIRVLNLVNLEESNGYNPFRYVRAA